MSNIESVIAEMERNINSMKGCALPASKGAPPRPSKGVSPELKINTPSPAIPVTPEPLYDSSSSSNETELNNYIGGSNSNPIKPPTYDYMGRIFDEFFEGCDSTIIPLNELLKFSKPGNLELSILDENKPEGVADWAIHYRENVKFALHAILNAFLNTEDYSLDKVNTIVDRCFGYRFSLECDIQEARQNMSDFECTDKDVIKTIVDSITIQPDYLDSNAVVFKIGDNASVNIQHREVDYCDAVGGLYLSCVIDGNVRFITNFLFKYMDNICTYYREFGHIQHSIFDESIEDGYNRYTEPPKERNIYTLEDFERSRLKEPMPGSLTYDIMNEAYSYREHGSIGSISKGVIRYEKLFYAALYTLYEDVSLGIQPQERLSLCEDIFREICHKNKLTAGLHSGIENGSERVTLSYGDIDFLTEFIAYVDRFDVKVTEREGFYDRNEHNTSNATKYYNREYSVSVQEVQ